MLKHSSGKRNFTVSVPCRGAMFLNRGKIVECGLNISFPSPVGELCFSIRLKKVKKLSLPLRFPSPVGELCFSIGTATVLGTVDWKMFPSPVGELCFSMTNVKIKKLRKLVSVPCRGAMFLNEHRIMYGIPYHKSFRPLSGSYVSQFEETTLKDADFETFPSPVGELCFSILIGEKDGTILTATFPSPVGELCFSII